jgi:hypothetical protein
VVFKIAPVELANPESGTPSACRLAKHSAASPAEYAAPLAFATGCVPAGETLTPPTSSDRGLTHRSQSATWSAKPTTGTLKEIHLTPT